MPVRHRECHVCAMTGCLPNTVSCSTDTQRSAVEIVRGGCSGTNECVYSALSVITVITGACKWSYLLSAPYDPHSQMDHA